MAKGSTSGCIYRDKDGIIGGRKYFIETNRKALWISRIAAVIIVALGIALIAALTTVLLL